MDGKVSQLKTANDVVKAEGASRRPTRDEAKAAVKTLLAWAGDDPARPGLHDTPERVVNAIEEWDQGYGEDPIEELNRTFDEVEGYDDLVMLRDIEVDSHCEHHMAPFLGKAYVAYKPGAKVVGISKLARVVEIFSRRLQNQEKLTAQIAAAIETALQPQGVAVLIDAEHQCMTTRGVRHKHVSTITTQVTGVFQTDRMLQERFLRFTQRS